MVLPYRTWKALVAKRMDIERLTKATEAPSLTIHELTVQLVKLREENIIKLTLRDACIYLKPATALFMIELDQCVEHVHFELYQCTNAVNEKFKYFVNCLRQNYIMNKREAIDILRKTCDKSSQIECELITYAIDTIVHDALKNE